MIDEHKQGGVTSVRLSWLSGFWDGEGSIGFLRSGTTHVLVAQLSHTELSTVSEVLEILEASGISGRGYTYQERDPDKHRDAHYIRITGIANVRDFGILLLPYAVTKRRHWEIAIAWANSRIAVAGGVNEKGHLRRGGLASARSYSENDMELIAEMKELNRRGPESRDKMSHGRIVL